MEHVLSTIRSELNKGLDGKKLWDVLTALRGPDVGGGGGDEVEKIKEATTCVIRYFFLDKPDGELYYGSLVYPDSEAKAEIRQELANYGQAPAVGVHFLVHAQKAFRALGLKWDELNT